MSSTAKYCGGAGAYPSRHWTRQGTTLTSRQSIAGRIYGNVFCQTFTNSGNDGDGITYTGQTTQTHSSHKPSAA